MNMRSTHRLFIAALVIASSVTAQQAGTVDRDYTINSFGHFGTSLISSTINIGPMANVYSTLDIGAPVVWLASPNANPGQLVFGPNSVDIATAALGFADLAIVADGTQPGILNSFFRTGGTGQFSLSVNSHAGLAGVNQKLGFLHFSPASSVGVYLSQVHDCTFTGNVATTLSLTDDSFAAVNIGFTLPFYGTNYTQCYVGSNGYVTFVAGDTTLTESLLGMTGSTTAIARPRIAMWWDDLNPTVNPTVASIRVISDNSHYFQVLFSSVAEYATTNSNTFSVTIDISTFSATMAYGGMGSIDGLVGMTPGTTGVTAPYVPAIVNALNLATPGGTAVTAGDGWYQLATVGPSIVANSSHVVSFDGSFNPIFVN